MIFLIFKQNLYEWSVVLLILVENDSECFETWKKLKLSKLDFLAKTYTSLGNGDTLMLLNMTYNL